LFLLIKRILLFIEINNFSLGLLLRYLGFFLLILEYFPFYFKGFLFENLGHSIDLANIAGLALMNILGISSIFHVTRGNILLFVVFIASTKSYVFFSGFSYRVIKRDGVLVAIFR
jgi:hypothetical protein